MSKLVLNDLETMATVMKEASQEEIMPRFGKIKAEEKIGAGGKEAVTAADRGASKYILVRRRLVRPGSFSEEDIDDDRFIYDEAEEYDPVDGTDEFIAGILDGFAMHGALVRRNSKEEDYRSIGGIIYIPGTEKLWYSDGKTTRYEVAGRDCNIPLIDCHRLRGWVRDLDKNTNKHKYDSKKRRIHLVSYMESQYRALGKILGIETEIIPGGGSGSSFSDLLEGKTNIILLPWDDSKDWDIAMADPIIRARGGFICDFAGQEYTYNRRDVLNRRGYVASIAFKKEEILPHLSLEMVLTKHRPA